MSKQIVIAEQHRIAAVFSEDQIQELIVATGSHQVGDIYLGVVENVLPGIDAAFVNLGDTERNGFIHVSDLGPVRLKRSAGAITELLAPQQKILIQVMKEPTGNKGPRLTGNISLPGRYLVLMPFGRGVNLSRRIKSDNERERLRALGILIKPAGMGLLVRTEAETISEKAIIEDLESLQKQWEIVQQQASSTRAPALLGRDQDFIQRVLRDVYSADVNRIVVDSAIGLKRVKQQVMTWNSNKLPTGVLIDHHRESTPILEYFRVNAAIREALKPRVDLPSGGYIIIERTEALTVIDVNSGSFTRSATARETVLWTNCEAATEIARQLRLRNVAGVIIVDFIDMDSRRDQLQVLEHFSKALKADKSRPQIAQLSELGLVELTRKRQGQNIYELFGRTCATCGGLGHLVHLPGEPADASGEMVERYVSPRNFEPSSRGRAPELPDLRSAELDLDPSEDLQELDLTNHPSYQDRGNTRRKRRPARAEAPPTKVTIPRAAIAVSPPPAETQEPPQFLEGNGNSTGRFERPEPGERIAKPSRQLTTKFKPQEPPEIVSVVMTSEEQDVFALMGLSPLILYNGEVKNPRSAIVSVALPGEEPVLPPPPINRLATREASSSEELPEASEQTPSQGYQRSQPVLKSVTTAYAPEPTEAADEEAAAFEAPRLDLYEPAFPDAEDGESADREVTANGVVLPRRRRRRSSAIAEESSSGEQLSFDTDAD
jgi:ribonuclease E